MIIQTDRSTERSAYLFLPGFTGAYQVIADERAAELQRRVMQDRWAMQGTRQRRAVPLWVPVVWRAGDWLTRVGTQLQAVHQQPVCATAQDEMELRSFS